MKRRKSDGRRSPARKFENFDSDWGSALHIVVRKMNILFYIKYFIYA